MTQRSEGAPDAHWFEAVAEHLGSAYLRYSFTKGTDQEVDFLIEALDLQPGMKVLDVGCGPGRHAHALARRGIQVLGIDISQRFIDLARAAAPPGATFDRQDARALNVGDDFDAAVSLCQGAFGLVGPGPDLEVLRGMARSIKPGGRVAVSAFSSYFSVKYQTDAVFDAATATAAEQTTIKNEQGEAAETTLWTTCYTPRELELLATAAALEVEAIWSVDPGAYRRETPSTESAEYLLLARRPAGGD